MSSVSTRTRGFRKDIQALRAFAVVFVLFNHLWPSRLAGGYIGVDVFFVVSGFLITQHLLKELELSGTIRLGKFYARRVRRLLPAAYVVSLVSLALAVVFLPLQRLKDIAFETFAASAYFENWLLAAKSVDYSAHDAAATTVQHYWSLSVEEQFYLGWPLLLLGIGYLTTRVVNLRLRKLAVILMLVIVVCSFCYACFATADFKPQAYFITFTRVWEFGVGSLAALLVPFKFGFLTPAIRTWIQLIGLVCILVSGFTFDENTLFPGPAALLPVVGTALVILAGPFSERSILFKPLESRPVQYIGDISYSLYLWHWPLIVISPFVIGGELHLLQKLIILVIAFGLAALTKTFVEDWGRVKLLVNTKTPVFFSLLAASVVGVLLVTTAVNFYGDTSLENAAKSVRAQQSSDCYGARALQHPKQCTDPYGAADVISAGEQEAPWVAGRTDCQRIKVKAGVAVRAYCDFSEGANANNVWLIGDSHSEQWSAAVINIAKKNHWNLVIDSIGGCPTLPVPRATITTPTEGSYCYNRAVKRFTELQRAKPDLVITSNFSSTEDLQNEEGLAQAEVYKKEAKNFADTLTAQGTKILVLHDIPNSLGKAIPECLVSKSEDPLACSTERSQAVLPDPYYDGLMSLNNPSVVGVDMTDYFCSEDRCYGLIGKVPVYFDDDHMSKSYSSSLSSALEQKVLPVLGK